MPEQNDNQFEHTLETPIIRGDQTITTVILRKPNVQTLRGLSLGALVQMDIDSVIKLLPRISTPTLTNAEIERLEPADILAICGGVSSFFLTRAQRESLPG